MANYPYKLPGTQLDDFRKALVTFMEDAENDLRRIENGIAAVSGIFKWQPPVPTPAALVSTYPNAKKGWAAMTTDTGRIYLYNGTTWEYIQQIDAGPLNALESRVTEILSTTLKQGQVSVFDIDKNKGKLDQTYMTAEFLQQMAGNAPINAVPAPGSITTDHLAAGAVDPTKISGVTISKNLFDKNRMTRDTVPNNSNGQLDPFPGFHTSDFIKVEAGEVYTLSPASRIVVYTPGKVFLSSFVNPGDTVPTHTVTIPTGGGFVRHGIRNAEIDNTQFEKGPNKTAYEPYRVTVSWLDPLLKYTTKENESWVI